MFSIASIQARPGQSVTMWCSHNIHVSGDLCWFKQTDGAVPITIVRMLYTESLQKVEQNYYNNFTKDLMVMDQFSKSTTLTIKQVKISDSGFYFCGAAGYHMKFGNGTRLEVKGDLYRALSLYSNYYILFIALFSHFVINSTYWKTPQYLCKCHNGKWLILANCFHIRKILHRNLKKRYVFYSHY